MAAYLRAWDSNDRDEPGEWEFDWHPLGIDGDLAMIEAETRCRDGRVSSNLWGFRLDAGTACRCFVEWYMPHPSGAEKLARPVRPAPYSGSPGGLRRVAGRPMRRPPSRPSSASGAG